MNDKLILVGVCAMNGFLIMVRQSNGKFRIIGDVPGWLKEFYPNLAAQDELIPGQMSPFLENFLEAPESIWLENKSKPLKSGIWTAIVSGKEFHLEASAFCIGPNQILLIEVGFENEQRYLQQARENLLRAYKTPKELANHIDSLLKPLKKPINRLGWLYEDIKIAFELLDSQISRRNQRMNEYRERMKKYLQLFETTVAEFKDFREFSAKDHFRAKFKSLERRVVALQEAPDVFLCAEEVVKIYQLSGPILAKRLNLQLDSNIAQTSNRKVFAQKKELEAVFDYLLESVVNSAQELSTVTVEIHDEGDFIITTIRNQGTGIYPKIAPTFSYKFDFCRAMIEHWGGTINVYNYRPEGGSGFRFRLPKLNAPR